MATIRERARKDGSVSYQVRWTDPVSGPDSLTLDTPGEAEALKKLLDSNGQSLRATERVLDDNGVDGPTVQEVMVRHIEQLTNAGPDTIARYRKAAVTHFSGSFGKIRVKTVNHDDIVAWMRTLQNKGLSPKTIANHHGLLSATMNTAVRMRYIDHNPCKGVKLPKSQHTEEVMRFLTREQWADIMHAMDPHYVPFFQLLIGTGMRFGEATALTAKDVSLNTTPPKVNVTKAFKDDGNGRPYIGPPKTRKSRRVVSIAPSTVEAIQARVHTAGEGLIFTVKNGGEIRSSQAHKIWGPACKAAGFTDENKPRIHDIRHTHASWMLAVGMDIYHLSRRLGHEAIATTLDRYSHVMPDAHFMGADIATKALGA